jgi:hypothetical protein
MQSPNQLLTVPAAAGYFPSLSADTLASPVFQDMLDDAMALINETLGLDLSAGPGVPVSQTFQPDIYPNAMLRLVVPMDQSLPVTVQEGPDQRVMAAPEFTRYANMLRAGGAWSNYYYFDRGHAFGSDFVAPVTVTYTPRDTVFRLVKTVMLDLVRLRLIKQNIDPAITTSGFAKIASVTDDGQTIEYSNGASEATYDQVEQSIIHNFLLKLRGPRIG